MRILLPSSLLAVLLCVSLGSADLVTPRKAADERIAGMGVRSTLERFKVDQGAQVLISGKSGDTCLGLYIFDSHGNCVAKDDRTTPQSSDDLVVEWVPAEAACFVEVRNSGLTPYAYTVAVR